MTDPEIEELVTRCIAPSCLSATSALDSTAGSTRLSLKYRARGKGEILIVNDGGKAGGIRRARQRRRFQARAMAGPGLTFGHVRKRLTEFAGLSPSYPMANRAGGRRQPNRTVAQRWAERNPVRPNSPAWRYLVRKRYLPTAIIEAGSAHGILREGPAGGAWFAHLDGTVAVTHVDVRGPTYKGSLTGGTKLLFQLPLIGKPRPRLVLTEAAIDALSVATVEALREDTLYAATGGGMGPSTIAALEALLTNMAMLLARSSAAPPTPTDLATALQTAIDLLRKNSMSHSRDFDLQSKVATGTTCFADALKQ